MKYQKYPTQTIKVAGDLRRAPATFENPVAWGQSVFSVALLDSVFYLPDMQLGQSHDF